MRFFRALRPTSGPPSEAAARDRSARRLIEQADAARDRRDFQAAVVLYEQALAIEPDLAAIHIQCGHMYKESGRLGDAETHYLAAARLAPDDADLALQLGHFYKVAGREEARDAAYNKALELRPGWAEPLQELADIRRAAAPPPEDPTWVAAAGRDRERLAPELAPSTSDQAAPPKLDGVHIRRLGARRERSRWGLIETLRGVEAVRGFCLSSIAIDEVRVLIDGEALHREPVRDAAAGFGDEPRRKYVFNAWVDVSAVEPGLHRIALVFMAEDREVRRHARHVVVAAPRTEAAYPDSDGVVDLFPGDPRSAETQVRGRPSMIRSARRAVLPEPRDVLVSRTDQLGDLVITIPALRRLRGMLPQSRMVGLLTPANAQLGETLGLFDEIIVIDFPYDEVERRRVMPLEAQEALRRRLEPYRFDIAIDLAEDAVSRPLLLLSGAKFTYGFHDRDWPWLTGGFDGATHDPANGLEIAPQSTRVMALVERLGASLESRAKIIRRPDLTWDHLRALELKPGEGYVVLHSGARIAFSRWPFYADLAALILQRTDLTVVLVTDDPRETAALPQTLLTSTRFRLIDTSMPFDTFDALLSYCAVFVGNDSGPKHLAALRGSRVVSLHSARINWNEWGQEMMGSIISRRVPCAGCAILHDRDECGKDFACVVDIGVEEVFAETMRLSEN